MSAGNAALSSDVTATISGTTITATVPFGTAVTALISSFSTSGNSVVVSSVSQTSGTTENDFSNNVTYRVVAADGTTKEYIVSISVASGTSKDFTSFSFTSSANTGLSTNYTAIISGTAIAVSVPTSAGLSSLKATFTTDGASVAVGGTSQSTGSTVNNFTNVVTYTVTALDSSTQNYTVTVTGLAGTKAISAFSFTTAKNSGLASNVTASISGTNITATFPYGTGVTALIPTFTTNGASVSVSGANQTSGTTTNSYSSSVTYTVTAEDATTQNYSVTASITAAASWTQQAYIKKGTFNAQDRFGEVLSINGDTLAVATFWEDNTATTITNGSGTITFEGNVASTGAVYVYKRTGTTWAQEAYIKGSSIGTYDFFGNSVSVNGDTLAVGAYQEDSSATTITNGSGAIIDDNALSSSGAVYVYKRTGSTWAQEAYIKGSGLSSFDYFGNSVSLSTDTLAVGVPLEDSGATTITNGSSAISDSGGANGSGAVYVYKRGGTAWNQEAYIKPSGGKSSDQFGTSVSLQSDTLAVGVPLEDADHTYIYHGTAISGLSYNSASSGAVYVFKRTGSTWAQEAYIKGNGLEAGDLFGQSVSLSVDTLAVGLAEDSSTTTIFNQSTLGSLNNSALLSGAVYIYKRTGSNWAQESFIKASRVNANDGFRTSISLDTDTLAVGVPMDLVSSSSIVWGTAAPTTGAAFPGCGSVYVYKRTNSTWAQEAVIKASGGKSTDSFGTFVSLNTDTLAVGTLNNDSTTTITNGSGTITQTTGNANASLSGAVHIFIRQ